MKIQAFVLSLFFALPVFADGALYEVLAGRLQRAEPGYSVDVRYPLLQGLDPGVTQPFNATSRERADQVAREFEKEAQQILAEAPQAPGASAQSLTVDFRTKHLSDRLLAVLMTGSEFTGGAHPNPFYYTLLLDPTNGRKVRVEELFAPGTEYLSLLSQLTSQQLTPRLEDLNTDAEWLAKGTAAEADNFQAVYPSETGLTVLFSPYQIAPYSTGSQEVVIPYAQLLGKLNDRFFDN